MRPCFPLNTREMNTATRPGPQTRIQHERAYLKFFYTIPWSRLNSSTWTLVIWKYCKYYRTIFGIFRSRALIWYQDLWAFMLYYVRYELLTIWTKLYLTYCTFINYLTSLNGQRGIFNEFIQSWLHKKLKVQDKIDLVKEISFFVLDNSLKTRV